MAAKRRVVETEARLHASHARVREMRGGGEARRKPEGEETLAKKSCRRDMIRVRV